jgi:hypothetical protein
VPLRKIDASARAARPDDTLGWALYAMTVCGDDDYRARWVPVAKRMLRRRAWPEYEQRAEPWADGKRAAEAARIQHRATRHSLGWCVPACWHLRVLRLLSAQATAEVIRCPHSDVAADF